jgi:hypothetical protein
MANNHALRNCMAVFLRGGLKSFSGFISKLVCYGVAAEGGLSSSIQRVIRDPALSPGSSWTRAPPLTLLAVDRSLGHCRGSAPRTI